MHSRKLHSHRIARHLASRMSRVGRTAKKALAAATTALLVASAVVLGVAAPASAHVPDATATCTTLSVNLTQYLDKVAGTDATYKTVYQRYQWNPKGPKSSPDAASTPLNDPNHWQASTSNYKGEDVNQQIQESNGNGGDNASWSYWTATQVVDSPATPAKANTVTVTINGTQVDAQEFGKTFIKDYTFTDKTVANDWSVTVVAWDGPTNPAWSKTMSGTSAPCVVPPVDNCPATDFTNPAMWEVTWGYDFEHRNGGAPVFTTVSNGGMTMINGAPLPSYMTSYEATHGAGSWHWLYITKGSADKTWTYTFADGTVRTATITGADCAPSIVWAEIAPVTNVTCSTLGDGGTATNVDQSGWTDIRTRTAGHSAYVNGGLHYWTDDDSSQAKVAWSRTAGIPLKDVGQLSINWTNNEPSWFMYGPGITLDITFAPGVTGQLIYEEVYGQDLWLNFGTGVTAPVVGGGNGAPEHGTINQWLALYPNAMIDSLGFGVGSGVHSDGVLHSITVGCTVYSFDYVAPAPAVCVGAGDWYTEADDAAPVATAEGLRFDGGSGKAVGYRVPVTGNLQGWTSTSYDATGTLSKFYYRIVIDPHAGDINGDSVDNWKDHYVSLTVTSGQPVDGSSVAYSNRLGTSKTLAEFAAMWPENQIASVGFHLDSAAGADASVLLKSVTGDCGTVGFVAALTEVKPIKPTWVDPCGLDNGHWVTTPQDGVTWETDVLKNGKIRITATAMDGYVLKGKHKWTAEDSGELCPANVTCSALGDGGTSTNLDANGWVDFDTRSAGHAEYVSGGLHVYTDDNTGNAKVSWAHGLNVPLSKAGVLAVDYTNNQPGWFAYGPGINLFVTFESGKTGTLVYEPVYGQDLWLTNGSNADVKANAPVIGGGNGSQWHGTIDQWLTKYPDAKITGFAFALGSGVHADGVLHSLTIGCNTYKFDLDFDFEFPTHALVNTSASMTNTTCTAAGSYTLEDTLGVQWWVNDKKVDAGTYQVKGASTVNVEATLIDEGDAWGDGENAKTKWTFTFTDPTDCLPTLAFTGADSGSVGLLLASGLLLAGGLILGFDRRIRRTVQ